jgi:hypothetical protein
MIAYLLVLVSRSYAKHGSDIDGGSIHLFQGLGLFSSLIGGGGGGISCASGEQALRLKARGEARDRLVRITVLRAAPALSSGARARETIARFLVGCARGQLEKRKRSRNTNVCKGA